MAHLFSPWTLRGATLRNRIVVSPMCQYSAGEDACATDWHLVHLGSRAVGGAGLVMVEATSVESRGRLSRGDLGIYDDRHIEPLARIVRFVHGQGALLGLQLTHAGRKAWTSDKGKGPELPVSAAPLPYAEDWAVPHPLDRGEVRQVVDAFRQGARRALAAGFDLLEIHAAHGYLIHQFLSPLTNQREDAYGGTLAGRFRLLHEVVDGVREVWPEEKPLFVRVSATDWVPGGWDIEQTVALAHTLPERGVDLVDCSSGGLSPQQQVPLGPGYQVPFAERVRREAGIPTAAVGLIVAPEMADEIIRNGRADLVVLARELLRSPYWPLHAARALGHEVAWPWQYLLAKR
ncbi:MAG: NADH:flavin oxidoreductase/NADH oxidase [Chloroflexi bacterium]|nr:NADH:flavin oxidoreductase/NADH oxidase [Chloroflexota bacterium]